MAKRKAKITLVGPLSYSVGRYRFFKDRPVLSEDEELISYCEKNPDFKTTLLNESEAAKPASPRQAAKKVEPKAEKQKPVDQPVQEAKAPKKEKVKPEPVSDEVSDDDLSLDSLEEEEDQASEEAASSSRLTRKKKKGDDA